MPIWHAARAGVAAGARHATHTFNAMRPLGHRDPGILGEVLTDSRLSADIIADGIHLDPAIVQLFLKAKGPEAAVLITDATAATGMPDGRYHLGSLEVEVKDGKCTSGRETGGKRPDHGPRDAQCDEVCAMGFATGGAAGDVESGAGGAA